MPLFIKLHQYGSIQKFEQKGLRAGKIQVKKSPNHEALSYTRQKRNATYNVDLVNDNVQEKFGLNLSIPSQDIEQKQILLLIKGSNYVANLHITMIYDTNIDLVNDNVYTKVGLNRSIRFQDIEQKLNSDVNQGP